MCPPRQVVLQFVDPSIGGRLVQRVTTRRMPVVSSLKEFLAGVHPHVAAVAMAKKAVLDAKKLGALWDPSKADEFRCSVYVIVLPSGLCGYTGQPSLVCTF